MSCLYVLILFEVFCSALRSSSALLTCAERKMYSALRYLYVFLFNAFITHVTQQDLKGYLQNILASP